MMMKLVVMVMMVMVMILMVMLVMMVMVVVMVEMVVVMAGMAVATLSRPHRVPGPPSILCIPSPLVLSEVDLVISFVNAHSKAWGDSVMCLRPHSRQGTESCTQATCGHCLTPSCGGAQGRAPSSVELIMTRVPVPCGQSSARRLAALKVWGRGRTGQLHSRAA